MIVTNYLKDWIIIFFLSFHSTFFFHHYICLVCLFVSLLGTKMGVWTCHTVIPMGNLNDPVYVFHPCLAMPSAVQLADLRGVRHCLLSLILSSLFTLAETVGIFIFPCSSVLWSKVHFLDLVQLLPCGSLAVWDLHAAKCICSSFLWDVWRGFYLLC